MVALRFREIEVENGRMLRVYQLVNFTTLMLIMTFPTMFTEVCKTMAHGVDRAILGKMAESEVGIG